jgi:hypothetical protein
MTFSSASRQRRAAADGRRDPHTRSSPAVVPALERCLWPSLRPPKRLSKHERAIAMPSLGTTPRRSNTP